MKRSGVGIAENGAKNPTWNRSKDRNAVDSAYVINVHIVISL